MFHCFIFTHKMNRARQQIERDFTSAGQILTLIHIIIWGSYVPNKATGIVTRMHHLPLYLYPVTFSVPVARPSEKFANNRITSNKSTADLIQQHPGF